MKAQAIEIEATGATPAHLEEYAIREASGFFGVREQFLQVARYVARPRITSSDGHVSTWVADITVHLLGVPR
jgi:hypothetical protein